MSEIAFHHIPVLPETVVEGLRIQAQGCYLDATVGGGGHSSLILASDPTVRLVAVDQDPMALASAQDALAAFGDRVSFCPV